MNTDSVTTYQQLLQAALDEKDVAQEEEDEKVAREKQPFEMLAGPILSHELFKVGGPLASMAKKKMSEMFESAKGTLSDTIADKTGIDLDGLTQRIGSGDYMGAAQDVSTGLMSKHGAKPIEMTGEEPVESIDLDEYGGLMAPPERSPEVQETSFPTEEEPAPVSVDTATDAVAPEVAEEVGDTAAAVTADTVADTAAAATAEIPGVDLLTGAVALFTELFTALDPPPAVTTVLNPSAQFGA